MAETSALAAASKSQPAGLAPQGLESMLAPVAAQAFLQASWGQAFEYIRGSPGKFSALLPWSALNQILEQHRLEPPRLRLTREGRPVPAGSFLNYQTNRRKSGRAVPRLMAAELTRNLRAGATLVLDAVEELHRPIRELAESLERVFRVRIQVNAYAGWRTSHGFDLHWDDHDVFILQIAGKKQWKVYGMTRRYPLARDIEPAPEPSDTPLWDGLLEDGDLLYIPRGWWHVATPLDEPTLHLTVGITNPTGADLLTWFIERLRASEEVRTDLPQFGSCEEQAAFLERLRETFLNEWKPDLVQRYLAEMDARSRSRPSLSLPWSATADILPPEGVPFLVKWAGSRNTLPEHDEQTGVVTLAANGRRWTFAATAEPLLAPLLSGCPCSQEQLEQHSGLSPSTVRAFLCELAENGLIAISEAPADR